MSRPKLKGETGTIRVPLDLKEMITRMAKDNKRSIPDFLYRNKDLFEKFR
jgi:hypothetical protein